MKLTLIIAAGVFLGGGALLLAVKGPAWVEQKEKEAAESQAAHEIVSLTPQAVIAACGKPRFDFTKTGDDESVKFERHMTLEFIGVTFKHYDSDKPDEWHWTGFTEDLKSGESYPLSDYHSSVEEKDKVTVFEPCMAKALSPR